MGAGSKQALTVKTGHRRVVAEDPGQLLGGEVGAVGDRDLPGVQRAPDADQLGIFNDNALWPFCCFDEPLKA